MALALESVEGVERDKGEERVRVGSGALGRVLMEAERPRVDVPRHATAVRDGFAVRPREPSEKRMRLVGELKSLAGASRAQELEMGSAAYVTTGAVVPPGTVTVVEQEAASVLAETSEVVFNTSGPITAASRKTEIREPGSDLLAGESVVARAGVPLMPSMVGLLTMAGVRTVRVKRRPRVAVLSTGDELVDGGVAAHASQVHASRDLVWDTNRPMLTLLAEDAANGGCDVVDLGICRDSPSQVEQTLRSALEEQDVDVVITTGGASGGERDFMLSTLRSKLGCTVHVSQLDLKPGKPTIVASNGRTLVFALPGNPCSALVTFTVLVAPALRVLAGWSDPSPRRIRVRLANDVPVLDERPEFQRASLDADGNARVTGEQRSSRLASALDADVLVELPGRKQSSTGGVARGSLVWAILLHDLRFSCSLVRESIPDVVSWSLDEQPRLDAWMGGREKWISAAVATSEVSERVTRLLCEKKGRVVPGVSEQLRSAWHEHDPEALVSNDVVVVNAAGTSVVYVGVAAKQGEVEGLLRRSSAARAMMKA